MMIGILVLIATLMFMGCSGNNRQDAPPVVESGGRFIVENAGCGGWLDGGCIVITDTKTGEEYLNCKHGYGESLVHLEKGD